MANFNDGKISQIADIQDEFGYPQGTDFGYIVTHANINWASKYKPFVYPANSFADDAARLIALRSRNCGIKLEKYATPTACLNRAIALGANGTAVTYLRPTGTIGVAPFRSFDFKGYDGTMGAPFRYGIVPSVATQLQTPTMMELGVLSNIALEDMVGNGTTDYPQLSSYKICLAWRKNGTSGIAKAQSVTSSANWLSTIVTDANYDVCCFLSPVDITYSDVEATRDYYLAPLPFSTFKYSSGTGVTADGDIVGGGGTMEGSFWANSGSIGMAKIEVRSVNPTNSFTIHASSHTITSTHETYSFAAPSRQFFTGSTEFYLRLWKNGSTYIDQRFYPRYSPLG